MAIASFKPDADVPVINNTPKIESQNFKSTVIDNSIIPISSLLAYVEGAPWTVDYFSQVITEDSDLKEQDIGELGIYQQYSKIKQMELRVVDSITGTQNTDTAQMTVTGTALVYPFLTPNVGDMFVTDAGHGQKGIYRIKSVERKSFNKLAVYSIEFNLMIFTETNSKRLADLNAKAINEYVFDKSRLIAGLPPTLHTKDYNNLVSLKRLYATLVEFYFKTFYFKEYDTLVIPNQNTGIYDSFLVEYILKIVDTLDAYEIRFVRNYATDNEPFLAQEQFWTALYNRDINILKFCNRNMGLVMTKFFNYNSMFKGFRFSRLTYVVYPTNPDFSLIDPNSLSNVGDPLLLDYGVFQDNVFTNAPIFIPTAMQKIIEVKTQGGSLADIINNTAITTNATIPVIYPVLANDTYLFSPAFYNQTSGQSLLETLTSDYILGNSINLEKLLYCVEKYRVWGRLEQFYYIPILLTLIKSSMQGVY